MTHFDWLTLIWVGERGNFTPCWLLLNTSEMVKALTLAFCSIQQHFNRDVYVKFGIPYLPQSPHIGQKSDGDILDFQISGQSLTKRNCHKSRTSDDNEIKLGPVTKLDTRNKKSFKK